mgnify:CR=1 FL=1
MDETLIGALLAFAVSSWPSRAIGWSRAARFWTPWVAIPGLIGLTVAFAQVSGDDPATYRGGLLAVALCTALVIAGALIGWVLKQAGLTVHVGGNIGIGVLALPAPLRGAVYVIETSSYQLDLTTSFAPDVAILTNISPDHLERHGDMAGYVAAKRRLFQRPGKEAVALVGVDEDWGQGIARDLAGVGRRIITISTSAHPGESRDPVLS